MERQTGRTTGQIVYKHHIKKHFDRDPSLYGKDNGPGAGATVFISYEHMREYLTKYPVEGVEWVWCTALVDPSHVSRRGHDTDSGMATLGESYPSRDGWRAFNPEDDFRRQPGATCPICNGECTFVEDGTLRYNVCEKCQWSDDL